MGAAETRRAIEAARRAPGDWASRPAAERAAMLRRLRDLMLEYGIDDWVQTRYLSLGGIAE
jgi:succinate-semialdehyde dehydrogenase/glutarate-semialdehyde dehydrogenase